MSILMLLEDNFLCSGQVQHEVTVTLKLIQVYVTDKNGEPISDLKPLDFELFDNAQPVKITEFERHILSFPALQPKMEAPRKYEDKELASPPARLSRKFFLLFDFAFNDAAGILKAKRAALHFVDQLSPADEVGLMSYKSGKGFTLHEYLTKDHEKIRKGVESFGLKDYSGRAQKIWEDPIEKSPKAPADEGLSLQWVEDHETRLLKNQILAFNKQLRDMASALRYIPGFKNIVLFSGGIPGAVLYGGHRNQAILDPIVDSGDAVLRMTYEEMSRALASADCPVFSINTQSPATAVSKPRNLLGDHSLKQLAEISGGKYFHDAGHYREIEESIRKITGVYYILGFYIDEKWDGKYHPLKVKVKRKGCQVLSQGGYYNPKPFREFTETEKILHVIDLALSEKPHLRNEEDFSLIALPHLEEHYININLIGKISAGAIKDVLAGRAELITLFINEKNDTVETAREEIYFSPGRVGDIFISANKHLPPGAYDCRMVVMNLETGRGARGISKAVAPEPISSAFLVFPPLLLIRGQGAFLFGQENKEPAFASIYAFDQNEYSPLIGQLERGEQEIVALIPYAFNGSSEPDINLKVFLFDSDGTSRQVPCSWKNVRRGNHSYLAQVTFKISALQEGECKVHFMIDESKTDSRSTVFSVVEIR